MEMKKILVPLLNGAGNLVMGYSVPSFLSLYEQDVHSSFTGLWA